MKFPTPDEVRASFEKSIEPVVGILRDEVMRLFSTPKSYNGTWSFDPMTVIAMKMRPTPPYDVVRAAFEVLKSELIRSGWSAQLEDSQRDGIHISIRPIGREDH